MNCIPALKGEAFAHSNTYQSLELLYK